MIDDVCNFVVLVGVFDGTSTTSLEKCVSVDVLGKNKKNEWMGKGALLVRINPTFGGVKIRVVVFSVIFYSLIFMLGGNTCIQL
jgi:hypothetical protein